MADSPFNTGKYSRPMSPRPGRQPDSSTKQPAPKAPSMQISCRATNPLSLQDDLGKVFLDERQAKATTATRLFRNEELFKATREIVGEFISSNRSGKFSMWSTGCSSGEEVYSMAMVALGEFDKAKKNPYLEACGTDINPQRIAEGRAGVYGRPGKDAFNANYWRLLNQYAQLDNNAVHMGDLLRSSTLFALFDMRKQPKKHTFQFIVCNHVLQYYDSPGQRHIIGNLIAVLKPGGYLYLEGVTDHGIDGLNLEKLSTRSNLYQVAKGAGGGSSSIFRK